MRNLETGPTIVIGAGLAGLTAARTLADAGREVVVLEAEDRVGGRAFSALTGWSDGQYTDYGGELVDDDYRALIALCERVGLEAEAAAPVPARHGDRGTLRGPTEARAPASARSPTQSRPGRSGPLPADGVRQRWKLTTMPGAAAAPVPGWTSSASPAPSPVATTEMRKVPARSWSKIAPTTMLAS